jgi:hypothetical protein
LAYYNYLGEEMPESAPPTSGNFGTTAGGETIVAPTGPSAIDGGGGGDILVAGEGDNFIYVKDKDDQVIVEDGLSGIKTVVVYSWYTLPENVHNLYAHGARNHAIGNELDNLIVLSNDAMTISGGAGNDVLVGGLGGNNFVVRAGEGNDVIYNFQSYDHLRLLDCSFMTFADIQAAMIEVGADVVLQITPEETLTFRNKAIADFTADNFLMPLDTSLLGDLTYGDDFDAPNFYDHSTGEGLWRTDFGGAVWDVTSYTLPANGEHQVYTTPDFQGTYSRPLGLNPFSFENGIMTITAEEIGELATYAYGRPYSSGMINTRDLFLQQYGYFEIRAQTPNVPGSWPAFWMIPDPANGVEADIMESLGISPYVDFVRVHGGPGSDLTFLDAWRSDPDAYHTYGMLWTAETVTMYLDGVAVLSVPTPDTWHQPMYMIANMAMGGWGGNTDTSQLPAEFNIDYIRAYELADGSSITYYGEPTPLSATIRAEGGPIMLEGAGSLTGAAVLSTGELAVAATVVQSWGGQLAVARVYDSSDGSILVGDFDVYGYSMPGDHMDATVTALDGGFWRIDYRGYEIHTNTGAPRYFQNEYTVGDPLFTPLVGGGQVIVDSTWDDVFLFDDGAIDWIDEPIVDGVRTTPTQVEALTNGGFVFLNQGKGQLDLYDVQGLHLGATFLGTEVADYAMAIEALAGGDFAVAWLTPPEGGGFDTQLTFQTFDANGAPLTEATFVALNRDPWHTEMRIIASDDPGEALLLWSEGGAIWGAFANGDSIGQATVLMVGSLSDTQQITLSDGRILFTWRQPAEEEIWAQILDPETLAWERQMLGDGDGDIHVVAGPNGSYAASWRDGDIIEARAYDGHAAYGPQAIVDGHFLGFDANGFLVSVYTDDEGQGYLQHYQIMPDPYFF